ncbi:MAG: NUDIX hydrolase [Pseudomonadota bacterium]
MSQTKTGERRGPWTIRATRIAYENPWMQVIEHDVLRPNGEPGLYGVMHPKQLAIGVLPVFANGDVPLVGQYRFAVEAYSWELPEGGGAFDAEPLDSARRELAEETGLSAAHWLEFLRFDISNSITSERAIAYLAWGLEQGDAMPDETEALANDRKPFAKVLAMAMDGRISDGFTLAMMAKADYMLRQGQLPEALAGALRAGGAYASQSEEEAR